MVATLACEQPADYWAAGYISKMTRMATDRVTDENDSSGTSYPRLQPAATIGDGPASYFSDEVRRLPSIERLLFMKGEDLIQAEKLAHLLDPAFSVHVDENPTHRRRSQVVTI